MPYRPENLDGKAWRRSRDCQTLYRSRCSFLCPHGKQAGFFSGAAGRAGLLSVVRKAGLCVSSVGKIYDIFAGQDVDVALPGHDNAQSMQSLYQAQDTAQDGLIFANFVDFDMLYGHRNDVIGYAQALEQFDAGIPQMLERLSEDDILAICADHGNDPTSQSTDHDREYVPLLVYGKKCQAVNLGVRSSFADLGQTAAEFLGAKAIPAGESFLSLLR